MRFVDTSVLLYAVSTAAAEAAKRRAARRILAAEDLALSVQVLQEFYVQATRPSRTGHLTHGDARALIESWMRFPVQETTTDLLAASLESCRRHRLSCGDAAVIEAARLLGCDTVLSEDLPHGRVYGGVRILDPFR
ncbi:MAG TPA: PIN domain-containing protein [Vicinamibacteria bacterium]|nr:PIN domain-containing protein [Vicinamibacteria bacterium]